MNVKMSTFVTCIEAIIYLLLHNSHDCSFNSSKIFLGGEASTEQGLETSGFEVGKGPKEQAVSITTRDLGMNAEVLKGLTETHLLT